MKTSILEKVITKEVRFFQGKYPKEVQEFAFERLYIAIQIGKEGNYYFLTPCEKDTGKYLN